MNRSRHGREGMDEIYVSNGLRYSASGCSRGDVGLGSRKVEDSPVSSSSSPRCSGLHSERDGHMGTGDRKLSSFHNHSIGNFLNSGGNVPGLATVATPSNAFHRTLSNSLTWPSRHRSQSSTTRDSSRRSEGERRRAGRGAAYPPLSPFALSTHHAQPLVDDLDLMSHEPAEEDTFREEFEEDARKMSLYALQDAVTQLVTETRVLQTEVARERSAVQDLYEGVSQNLSNTEKQQEQTANKLIRYLHSLQRKKVSLQRHLKEVQVHKQEQEKNLRDVQQSVMKLKAHLKSEEDVIAQRIKRKIAAMQEKRIALENALRHETYSIQQLENLVNEFQNLDASEGPPRKSSVARNREDSSLQDDASSDVSERHPSGNGDRLCSRSGSQASVTSSNAALASGSHGSHSSSHASIRLLQKAIAVLEHLRLDAQRQEALYSSKTEELQKRVEAEMTMKREELLALQHIQEELAESRKQCCDAEDVAHGRQGPMAGLMPIVGSARPRTVPGGLRGGVSHVSRSVASTSSYCDTLDGMGAVDLVEGMPTNPRDPMVDEESLVTTTEASSVVSHSRGPALFTTGHGGQLP